MGYYNLRKSLQVRAHTIQELASLLNMSYTMAYFITSKETSGYHFTEQQKDQIMLQFFNNSKMKREEIFKDYAYSSDNIKR